jgi:Spy/CpxP family protein refolding chaperone
MPRFACLLLFASMVMLSGALAGQEPKKEPPKKDEPPVKAKGFLPNNWKKIGLTEDQVQQVYKIQAKYGEEIDKLEAKIAELKAAMDKERKAVLTADQKKKLEEILLGKDK